MSQSEALVQRLAGVASKLTDGGQPDLARELDAVISALRQDIERERPPDVMTTGEAATILGVRSVFTIKRWAREGILDGFRRGSRILVTRESVERLLRSPKVAEERAAETDLGAFDAGDEPAPAMAWTGRKPWVTPRRQGVDERAQR
jgi:excisionase family DNA binding protein